MKHTAVGERKVGDEVQPTDHTARRQIGHRGVAIWHPMRSRRTGPCAFDLADLGAKHAFLCAGLGWGLMPRPMVEEDIARGALVKIELEAHAINDYYESRGAAA